MNFRASMIVLLILLFDLLLGWFHSRLRRQLLVTPLSEKWLIVQSAFSLTTMS